MKTLTFAEALTHVITLASDKMPDCLQTRLAQAAELIGHGSVFLEDDGHTASVRSRSQADVWHLVNGTCDGEDAHFQAPQGLCAHRLAVGLVRRAAERLRQPQEPASAVVEETPAPSMPPALPEAPASVNVRLVIAGRDCQVTLRDTDETWLLTRLDALLARYPLAPAADQPTPEGWCLRHATQMKLNHGKDGSTWYSHKTDQGWCKGKGGAA